ncbi:unnamed protein product [Somion occarium]|uniref:Uncharacterized protein n=1 Tax=Somion occarium TaxID=3059160 RepID=A0ABP1CI50_9APHY
MVVGIIESRCVLVLGATSGIGRSLALALHDLPSKPTVIVGGRRQERLDELAKTSDRIKGVQVDVTAGREALRGFVKDTLATYPDLDAVIFSSGIQLEFDFNHPEQVDLDALENELTTNYTSIVTLITLFLPHFLKLNEQGRPSFIIPVSSALSIVPAPWVPNYAATKAAIHSLSISLGAQFRETNIRVLEVIPPLVESELHDRESQLEFDDVPRLSSFLNRSGYYSCFKQGLDALI